ncbi:MAG: hypothetical protein ABGZ35_20395 [Planctomycetaceae bacterium]
MARGVLFVCNSCDHTIEAWDDGNPYYFDEAVITKTGVTQKKIYAYHPSAEFDQCVGNDSPHLCLSCGKDFMVDSEAPITACPKCTAREIVDTWSLGGKTCPYCHTGVFDEEPGFHPIS